MWKCTQVEGTWFIDADLRLECQGAVWEGMSAAAGIFFVLYPFGIPACFCVALFLNRGLLKDAADETKQKEAAGEDNKDNFDLDSPANSEAVISLGWLATAYEPQFWFWELCEFFRKFVLSAVLVFVQPGTSAQILVATMVSVLFLGLVSYFKPYDKDQDDTFGFVSFICLVYTLVLGLALRVAQTEDLDVYQQAIYGVALFLVNMALILMTLHAMLSNFLAKKKTKAENKYNTDEEQKARAQGDTTLVK